MICPTKIARRLIRLTLNLLFATLFLSSANYCEAQVERYELGKRLRRFEEAWQIAPAEVKTRSAPILQQAVSDFFSLNLLGAAEKLDQAWIVTRSEQTVAWQKAVISYQITLPAILVDQAADSISVGLRSFYNSQEKVPDGAIVSWSIMNAQSQLLIKQECSFTQATEGISLGIQDLPQGDYRVSATVHYDGGQLQLPSKLISRVNDWPARSSRLSDVARNQELALNDSLRATLRDHVNLLNRAGKGDSLESDYAFFQLLSLDELLISQATDLKPTIRAAAEQHDVWLNLAKGRTRVPVRLRCPSPAPAGNTTSQPLPVLFLLHGAGGSENMFFETYGAGGAVTAGLNRGWLVIAPRLGFTGLALNCQEMLDALDSLFEIDRKQVYVVGHSMGATEAIRQAMLHPQLFKAGAVIGGGSRVRDAQKISGIAWYVAAGELDFGKPAAKGFYESMSATVADPLRYQEFSGIEHLVIVQACLDDLFKFFDWVAKPANR
jgi:pimeloyl-ACP methyl ester carboxylesterase